MKDNTNIRKVVIWLVIIAAVSLTVALINFMYVEDYFKGFQKANNFEENLIDEVKNFNIDNLKEIYINSVSAGVSVFSTDEKDIKVHFHGKSLGSSKQQVPKLTANVEGDMLKIVLEYPKTAFSFIDFSALLDIYLPLEYTGNIMVETVSAGIGISNLNINNLQCETVSGGLRIKSLILEDCILKTTSGGISITDFTGNLKAESISGGVDIGYKSFYHNVDIKTTSGGIKIDFPKDAEFYLKANTFSGEVVAKFPITITNSSKKLQLEGVVGAGNGSVIIESVSGNIYLNK